MTSSGADKTRSEALVGAVHRLTRLLADAPDTDTQLRATLETAIEATGSASGSILFHDESTRELRFCHVLGSRKPGAAAPLNLALLGSSIRDDEGIAGQVFQSGKAVAVNSPQQDPRHSSRIDKELQHETRNLATVPISISGGRPVGVLQLLNKEGGFTDEDLGTASALSSMVALAIALERSRT